MEPTKTIPAHKSAFLRAQIRLLSTPLRASSTWRDSPPTTTTSTSSSTPPPPLPQSSITIALETVNAHLQTHNRTAYPPQTQRHTAEQIDALYWSDVTAQGLDPAPADSVVVGTEVDLSTPEGVDALPGRYEELFLAPVQHQHQHQDSARYQALRARLRAAVSEQRRQRARLEGYRKLLKLLEPFDAAGQQDPVGGDDGELGRELVRLRGLVGRVAERVGGLGDGEGHDLLRREGGEGEKLRDVMEVL